MSSAKKFIDNFEKTANMIAENAPENLKYAVLIYARDTDVKTDKFPDGDIWFKMVDKTNHYDRASFWQYIKEQFFRN